MNPIVSLALKTLIKYVENHPEVLEQLISQALDALISHLKASNAAS